MPGPASNGVWTAIVGESEGYWLDEEDFRSAHETVIDPRQLGALGFPREWPAVYRQNEALQALLGKRGVLGATRVAVAGPPTEEERAQLPSLVAEPLQSFANAERAAAGASGLSVVRGWAVFERLDRPVGTAFVAERYWWNALPSGRWVDLTPRPPTWERLLLAEADKSSSSKAPAVLTAGQAALARHLFEQRFPGAVGSMAPHAAEPATLPQKQPSARPSPTASPVAAASAPRQRGSAKPAVDYSKFDHIEDSDDEKPVVRQQVVTLPYGMPREAVVRGDYNQVWRTLLGRRELPFTPPPDLDGMWGFYRHGGMDEQALLDQACELLAGHPCRLEPGDYKSKTYGLTKKLELAGREDEARMWSLIFIGRFPQDPDGYYNQGVLLNKICDRAKFGGAPTMRLPSLDGAAKNVPTEQYCSLFSRAAIGYYRRCLKVDPRQRAAYINLIGSLERNEPQGWYDDVQELAAGAVKNAIWYNRWQRPPHFVPSLLAKPWHDPQSVPLAVALEENAVTIRAEYDAYIERLANRKDWDDSDKTPGPGDVGQRDGALHDGGLRKSGHWREVPLFSNCTLNREYAEYFPRTVEVLQRHCMDAVGLALCGGGDVIFSVLTPGTRLRPHCGPSNSRLTCHLGVRIPLPRDRGCWVRVAGDAPRGWEEGRCIVFDDSFEHEVCFEDPGPSEAYPGDRVVLLANFWHPGFEFKNDPEWRAKSDPLMAKVDVESLPQTAVMKASP